jgi:hypothetical protein
VAQLGAGRYADRESATSALLHLGRFALPALRENRQATDPEVRARVSGLIRRIEGALLTEPTKVRLDFDDLPIREIVDNLKRQTGFGIVLAPETNPRWRSERLTLHHAGPIDFWKAIDEICDLADFQYSPNMHALTSQGVRTVTPNSDFGPFRVSLLGVHYQRDVNYAGHAVRIDPLLRNERASRRGRREPAQPNPVLSVHCTAQLLVVCEPRLSMHHAGAPRLLEAADERGNSLMPPPNEAAAFLRDAGYFGLSGGSVMQVQAIMHRPALPGETIKKLRGSIPVTVSSRQPDPLIVPLEDSAGKTFGGEDAQITVHRVQNAPNNRRTIELTVNAPDERLGPAEGGVPGGFNSFVPRASIQQLPIEIIDSRGQKVAWSQTGFEVDTAGTVLTVTVTPHVAPLKELRYYILNRATTSIPFEFTNIPMP